MQFGGTGCVPHPMQVGISYERAFQFPGQAAHRLCASAQGATFAWPGRNRNLTRQVLVYAHKAMVRRLTLHPVLQL